MSEQVVLNLIDFSPTIKVVSDLKTTHFQIKTLKVDFQKSCIEFQDLIQCENFVILSIVNNGEKFNNEQDDDDDDYYGMLVIFDKKTLITIEKIPIPFPIRKIRMAEWKSLLFIMTEEGLYAWKLKDIILIEKSFLEINAIMSVYCSYIAGVIHVRNDELIFSDVERNSIHFVNCKDGSLIESIVGLELSSPISVDWLDSDNLMVIEKSNEKLTILGKETKWKRNDFGLIEKTFEKANFIVNSKKYKKILVGDLNGIHIFNQSNGKYCETLSNSTKEEKLYCLDETNSTIYSINKTS